MKPSSNKLKKPKQSKPSRKPQVTEASGTKRKIPGEVKKLRTSNFKKVESAVLKKGRSEVRNETEKTPVITGGDHHNPSEITDSLPVAVSSKESLKQTQSCEHESSPPKVEDQLDDRPSKFCFICWDGEQEDNPLVQVCRCRGTLKYIHTNCMEIWVCQYGKTHCQICGHHYSFILEWRPFNEWGFPGYIGSSWPLALIPIFSILFKFLDLCLRFCDTCYSSNADFERFWWIFYAAAFLSIVDTVLFWFEEWDNHLHNAFLDGFTLLYANLLLNYILSAKWEVVLVGTYGYSFLRAWQQSIPLWQKFRKKNCYVKIIPIIAPS